MNGNIPAYLHIPSHWSLPLKKSWVCGPSRDRNFSLSHGYVPRARGVQFINNIPEAICDAGSALLVRTSADLGLIWVNIITHFSSSDSLGRQLSKWITADFRVTTNKQAHTVATTIDRSVYTLQYSSFGSTPCSAVTQIISLRFERWFSSHIVCTGDNVCWKAQSCRESPTNYKNT